jgi:Protein of unknown function (DUF3224)
MSTQAIATFEITEWNESTITALENGVKLTRASIKQAYTGAIQGSSVVEYLMAYCADKTATFVGQEQFTGSVNGKSGSFFIQHNGAFGAEPSSNWFIVAGSGTGQLQGIAGKGSYAVVGGTMQMTIDYDV